MVIEPTATHSLTRTLRRAGFALAYGLGLVGGTAMLMAAFNGQGGALVDSERLMDQVVETTLQQRSLSWPLAAQASQNDKRGM